eukprot:gnl/Chilomastix_cuspidata/2036.p1 GENE.gnl/Chilomastix_cuspidata/2036~~gnl/Chilomastix_cuspidata/2036.p1  ORF type:complete len:225 (+),score=23.70 gnl/Chilomastix_cuspidata/2036:352-1026(+)
MKITRCVPFTLFNGARAHHAHACRWHPWKGLIYCVHNFAQMATPRHDWFQSGGNVIVTVYAKGANADETVITLNEQHLSVQTMVSGNPEPVKLDLMLAHPVKPEFSQRVTPYKIEITLQKETAAEWTRLTSDAPLPEYDPRRYPSSAATADKRGVDWDALIREEAEEGAGGDPMDAFRALYANASDDARRAMNKSYTESGGTVLSMDWSKVGSGHVDPYKDDRK